MPCCEDPGPGKACSRAAPGPSRTAHGLGVTASRCLVSRRASGPPPAALAAPLLPLSRQIAATELLCCYLVRWLFAAPGTIAGALQQGTGAELLGHGPCMAFSSAELANRGGRRRLWRGGRAQRRPTVRCSPPCSCCSAPLKDGCSIRHLKILGAACLPWVQLDLRRLRKAGMRCWPQQTRVPIWLHLANGVTSSCCLPALRR